MFLYITLIVVHIFVSIALVVSVLLQSGKGGGLAGTFGGSGVAGGVFGGRGAAPFLTKATTVCAILFMVTSLSLSFIKPGAASKSSIERIIRESGPGKSSSAVTTEMPLTKSAPAGNAQGAAGDNAAKEGSAQENKTNEKK